MSARSFSQTQFEKAFEYEKVTFIAWIKLRRYFLLTMLLILIHDVISRIRSSQQGLASKIIFPIVLSVILASIIIIQALITKTEDAKKRLILEVVNDIYQILVLTLFISLDHANSMENEVSLYFYEEAFKILALIFLGMNTLYFWISKLILVAAVMATDLIIILKWGHEDTFEILAQGAVRIFCFVGLVFIYERMKKTASKSYVLGKTLEISLKRFIDFLDQGIIALDKTGKPLYWNKYLSSLLEQDKVLGEAFPNLDLSLIQNIKWKKDFSKMLMRNKTGISRATSTDPLFWEDTTTTSSVEKPQNLKGIIQVLTSKWTQTIDYFEELGYEGRSFMLFEAEKDDLLLEVKVGITIYQEHQSLIVIISNITERNKLEQLQENIKFKDSYLLSISHELMNPLHGSLSFLQGALEESSISKTIKQEFLLPTKNSLNFLQYLINDLLDFTNLHANTLKLRFHEHSLIETVEEAINLITLQAKKKGLEISRVFEIPQSLMCTTDHKRLLQILLNLLENALRFTFKGTITVRVSKKTYKEYSISIEDTGIGMREEEKLRILDHQGKITKSFFAPGFSFDIGFGLLISNELAKRLGPTARPQDCGLFCQSEFQQGSIFGFTLEDKSFSESIGRSGSHYQIHVLPEMLSDNRSYDVEFEESSEIHQDSPNTLTPHFLSNKIHMEKQNSHLSKFHTRCYCPEVLLVDSEMFSITSLERILNICNFSTLSSFNGVEALNHVRKRKENKCSRRCRFFELIFVAGNMPLMNGCEFISAIYDMVKKNEIPNVPIIACLSTVGEEYGKKARELGAVDCLIKPFTKDKVLHIIEKLF